MREAGQPWDIGPGNPNPRERIEGGMISYGGDTDDNANPIELRMDKFVDLDLSDEVIGITALRRIQVEGPKRHQLGIVLEGHKEQTGHAIWYDVFKDGQRVGSMTNGGFSPRMGKFIGYVLVARDVKIGDNVVVHKNGAEIAGALCELPFI